MYYINKNDHSQITNITVGKKCIIMQLFVHSYLGNHLNLNTYFITLKKHCSYITVVNYQYVTIEEISNYVFFLHNKSNIQL